MSAYFDSMNRRAREVGPGAAAPSLAPVAPATPVGPAAPVAPVPASGAVRPVSPAVAPPRETMGAFDALREQLAVRGNGRALQAIVFVGCGGPEPCSGFVRAFGNALAAAGSRVLLVDAARAATPGEVPHDLASAVRSGAPVEADMLGRGRLATLSVGLLQAEKEALVRSSEFAAWLATQRTAFDYVFFAAPPALRFADAVLLGRAADGVILLVESEATERSALSRVRDQLDRAGVNLIGAVLDGVRDELPPMVRRYIGE